MTTKRPQLSIVTTLYRSAPFVETFSREMSEVARSLGVSFELVFVDDGSPDDAAGIAEKLAGPVRVVKFSRNFGHHQAMMAACAYAQGDHVFLIDSDLEEDPSLLAGFWKEMEADPEVDVLFGVQKRRKGGWFERISGDLFYRFFNFLSDVKVPQNLLTVRLMKRRYVDALLLHGEKSLFIAGLWASTGFKQRAVEVTKKDKGESSYRFTHKLNLIINSITSFSTKPLRIIFFLSFLSLVAVILYSAHIAYLKITHPTATVGYASIIISIWLFGGLTLFSLGILGMYVSKLFVEVKNRPLYIVKEVVDKTGYR